MDYYRIGGTNILEVSRPMESRRIYTWNSHVLESFQFQKHLNIGKGGMILTDDKDAFEAFSEMVYDGRERDNLVNKTSNTSGIITT